jgi:hypothetical protein
MHYCCWSAQGSRLVLPWTLAVLLGSPGMYVARCAFASLHFLPDLFVEASDVASSMTCVRVKRVGMRLRAGTGMRPGSRPVMEMFHGALRIVHVGSYYAYTLFGRVEGVPRARTEFIYAFCNDLRRKTAQCVGILIRYYVISLISHVSRAPTKRPTNCADAIVQA